MKRIYIAISGLLLLLSQALMAEGPAIKFGADANSAYVFHGMTYNSGPVIQPMLEIAGESFIFTSWNNYNLVSDDNGLGHFEANELTEMDWFFTYLLPIKFICIDATVGFYNYPALDWESDKEFQIGAEKTIHDLFTPFARGGYMFDGAMKDNLYIEFGAKGKTPIIGKLEFNYNVKASWERQPYVEGVPSGFKHLLATAGLTYMLKENIGITGKANYVGQLDNEILADELYDIKFHGSLGFFITF